MIATIDAVRSSAIVAVASLIVRGIVVLLWFVGAVAVLCARRGGAVVCGGLALSDALAVTVRPRRRRWRGCYWRRAGGSSRRCVHRQRVQAVRLTASRLRVVVAIAASAGATSSLHRAASSLSAAEPRGRSLRQAGRRRRGRLRVVSSRPG